MDATYFSKKCFQYPHYLLDLAALYCGKNLISNCDGKILLPWIGVSIPFFHSMTIIESLIVVIQNILQFGFYFIIRPIKKAIRLLGLIQNNFFKYMNIQNARKENHKTPSFPSFYRQNCQNLRHKLFWAIYVWIGIGRDLLP